jgi:hypothetical protein
MGDDCTAWFHFEYDSGSGWVEFAWAKFVDSGFNEWQEADFAAGTAAGSRSIRVRIEYDGEDETTNTLSATVSPLISRSVTAGVEVVAADALIANDAATAGVGVVVADAALAADDIGAGLETRSVGAAI